MLEQALGILATAVLCGAWVAFQRWLRHADPHGRHIESGGGCGCGGGGGGGGGHCETPAPRQARVTLDTSSVDKSDGIS